MANYQLPRNLTLNQPGENNTRVRSWGAAHPAQHALGATTSQLAQIQHTHTPVASEADQAIGAERGLLHARINFNPIHTCAACKQTHPNNYALERHAAKERHKAFLCTCTIKFVRLATLKRHIAAQAGPKHHCIYCDGDKSFAREDKLIDHLRASHKFGEKAITQFRSQARTQLKGKEQPSSAAAKTGIDLPVSTSAGYDAIPGGLVAQDGHSAGPSTGPSGTTDGGLADFPVSSADDIQPFGFVQDHPFLDAAEDLAGFDFGDIDLTGFDFAGVDWDMDMTGMNNF